MGVRQFFDGVLGGLYDRSEIGVLYRCCLCYVCGVPARESYFYKDSDFDENEAAEMRSLALRLSRSEPVDYVLGSCEFLSLPVKVDPRVLIPRPETQELAGIIISRHKSEQGLSVLDLCTGSGCLAIALAHYLPGASSLGVDVSEGALALARENAALNHARAEFLQADLLSFDPAILGGRRFDIICCNPPYVRRSEQSSMAANVLGYEPHLALFVDDADPLVFYRAAARICASSLAPSGSAYFEINAALAPDTAALFRSRGFAADIVRDLAGRERFVFLRG